MKNPAINSPNATNKRSTLIGVDLSHIETSRLLDEKGGDRLGYFGFGCSLDFSCAEAEISFCKNWISRNASPGKKPKDFVYSYRLKHLIEPLAPGGYISNGSAIAASLALGYRIRRESNSRNAFIEMRLVEMR